MKQKRGSKYKNHEWNEKQHSMLMDICADFGMQKQEQSSEGYQAEQLHLGGSCAF